LIACRKCKSKDCIHCWLSKSLPQAFLKTLRPGDGCSFSQIHFLWRCLVQSQFGRCYPLGKSLLLEEIITLSVFMLIFFFLCSVFTPYYSEIVLYSMAELLKKNEDGISILFYLQKIYPGSFYFILLLSEYQSITDGLLDLMSINWNWSGWFYFSLIQLFTFGLIFRSTCLFLVWK